MAEENKTEFKEYQHERVLFRSKWYPLPLTLLFYWGIYEIVTDRIPADGWRPWWWGVLILAIVPLWLWLWFYFDISHWPKKIRLTREGFTTWDPFNRERHYKWDELKWIEEDRSGLGFIFKKRQWGIWNYFGVHHFLIDYDDFIRAIKLYAPQVKWRPAKIHWF